MTRRQAILWGINHGFTRDHNRIEHWRGGLTLHCEACD
jgi:hypothetical protein